MPDSENWPLHCVEKTGVTGREMDLCPLMGLMSGVYSVPLCGDWCCGEAMEVEGYLEGKEGVLRNPQQWGCSCGLLYGPILQRTTRGKPPPGSPP